MLASLSSKLNAFNYLGAVYKWLLRGQIKHKPAAEYIRVTGSRVSLTLAEQLPCPRLLKIQNSLLFFYVFLLPLSLPSTMIKSVLLRRFTSNILLQTSCSRGSGLLAGRTTYGAQPLSPGRTAPQQSSLGPRINKVTALVRCSDSSANRYSMIYTLPHIRLLRTLSRMKLLQTAITVIILPPVYIFYFQGVVPFALVSYTTCIALFAGVMLYTASHFFRRVVGRMYLDPSQTTLKVSHLTFWGRRHDLYLPVSDVMTIADTGDSVNETIVRLKRFSGPQTLYFSPRFGRVVDKQAFEKVFGTQK
ncbi:transmembrane protein 186 [Spinachia spinachia]